MSALLVSTLLLLVGLTGQLMAGHSTLTTTTPQEGHDDQERINTPRDDQRLFDKLSSWMELKLNTLKQAMESPPQCCSEGSGSSQDVLELKNKLLAMEAKMEADLRDVKSELEVQRKAACSTFVRWGKKTCSNSTQHVYSGVAGGSLHSHSGAAANPLCLTLSPQFGSPPEPRYTSFLYGAEYEALPIHDDHDIPCSVCRTPHSTTLMIPTTHSCPAGWTVQYSGYLAAGLPTYAAASEYVCLDSAMEHARDRHLNQNGYLLYLTSYVCGALPCPPFVNGAIALCVVCSK